MEAVKESEAGKDKEKVDEVERRRKRKKSKKPHIYEWRTVVFIRHGKSKWNAAESSILSKVGAVAQGFWEYHKHKVATQKNMKRVNRDNTDIMDAPLSREGIMEALRLSSFLRYHAMKETLSEFEDLFESCRLDLASVLPLLNSTDDHTRGQVFRRLQSCVNKMDSFLENGMVNNSETGSTSTSAVNSPKKKVQSAFLQELSKEGSNNYNNNTDNTNNTNNSNESNATQTQTQATESENGMNNENDNSEERNGSESDLTRSGLTPRIKIIPPPDANDSKTVENDETNETNEKSENGSNANEETENNDNLDTIASNNDKHIVVEPSPSPSGLTSDDGAENIVDETTRNKSESNDKEKENKNNINETEIEAVPEAATAAKDSIGSNSNENSNITNNNARNSFVIAKDKEYIPHGFQRIKRPEEPMTQNYVVSLLIGTHPLCGAVCSNLRRAISTCIIALWDRLERNLGLFEFYFNLCFLDCVVFEFFCTAIR